VQEKKGVPTLTTQPGGASRGDSEEIHSLQQQLATQEQQLATQEQQLATQEQQLATQREQLTTQGQQLEHHLTDQQHKNRELTSRVEHLTREQASLQHQNEQLTTQLQQQAKELQELTTQDQQLTTQVQQQAKEMSTLQSQNREQNQQLTQLTTQVQQQRGEFQALLQQVQSLQPSWSIAQHHLQITTQVLGRGAWGEVRVGIYQGTRVAVKKMHDVIISNHNREQFEREMVIASKVRHPNLLLFIGAVTTGNLTIVSELMETSLRKLLEEKKLKVSNLRPISKDVACALAYLHSLPDPIVHRDVSSANVLLYAKQDGWCAKLSDFGSANFLAKLGTVAPGAVIYSAPEALHPRQQGPKMDVYSFGILLFEMCVGKLIDQHNLQTTKAAVANWTDREKKFLGEFALRCTETNPDKRPNMADFVKQI
jgi:hypothetical protein